MFEVLSLVLLKISGLLGCYPLSARTRLSADTANAPVSFSVLVFVFLISTTDEFVMKTFSVIQMIVFHTFRFGYLLRCYIKMQFYCLL